MVHWIALPFIRRCKRFGFALFICLVPMTSLSASIQVRVPSDQNDRADLHFTLLTAALDRGGKYRIDYPYGDIKHLPLSTRINGVQNGELDVFFALTTPEYERDFIPVYIPLYRGVMGMRLAIIKNSNRSLFEHVRSLDDLKRFTAGQGQFWADSDILERNGIPLVRELKYPNLFRMLEAERFHYFPRGIHEPWGEVEAWKDLDLSVDEHIMLWYTVPYYCFVSRSKPELASHLEEQLEAMVADGSFQKRFFEDDSVKLALRHANLENRRVIKLENPFLSPGTPLDRAEFWFDPRTDL